VAAVANVGPSDPIDQDEVAADPDVPARMVLGVDREDAARSQDDVVNV
jgi:hypothetical protein